jgi:hypothetical protein
VYRFFKKLKNFFTKWTIGKATAKEISKPRSVSKRERERKEREREKKKNVNGSITHCFG